MLSSGKQYLAGLVSFYFVVLSIPVFAQTVDSQSDGQLASVLSNVRIRGNSGDLVYANGSPGYSSSSKATLSLSDNGVTKTESYTIQAALGYGFNTPIDESSPIASQYWIVPYVAANYAASQAAGKATKYSSETIDTGAALQIDDLFRLVPSVTDINPDYLFNQQDGSRLWTLHMSYLPYFEQLGGGRMAINSAFALWPVKPGEAQCKGELICNPYLTITANIRSDVGDYVNRGNAVAQAANLDFVRAGGQVGVDLAVPNAYDLTVTETDLYGFSGARRDVSDFEASLSLYFGNQNTVGLTLGYKNGLLEQTALREQSWTIGFTVKN